MSPALAVSLGEPSGIGPEIIARAWQARHTGTGLPVFFAIGDVRLLKAQGIDVAIISNPAQAEAHFHAALPVLDHPLEGPVVPGKPDLSHGAAVAGWIEAGVRLCLEHRAAALVTGPIHKASLYQSGFAFPGHTEFIGALAAGSDFGPRQRGPLMMLSGRDPAHDQPLRIVLSTIHIPIKAVPDALKAPDLITHLKVIHEALRLDFGLDSPRIAVCGLNPHAGEEGTIGTEEINWIKPIIDSLRPEMQVSGPHPADSLFHPAARKTYDAVLCHYHDQGLIPLKMLDFWGGVNITLGLPIIRTSPDHGTALDIAGQGKARPDSLISALITARQMADRREGH